MKWLALALPLALSGAALAQSPAPAPVPTDDTLIFQTGGLWSPRVNLEAGTVMAYGINQGLPDRIRSWKEHGYRVTVMTGVAWGTYGDYLRGDFDGKPHWNETQQDAHGNLILHSGREVPYIAPSESYGKYLSQGVLRALDAGADAIYLEEPEFWARAGWSDSFKKEWESYYHEPWRAPDSSPDAQYRASKLKYFLYRRALEQVFTAVREWGQQHNRRIPCYVATHSLINYSQWQIVSPESSLLDVGADGYIAQVWTGTSRAVNVYEGVRAERTFETAFLEYGALQNIARSSGKRIWYLNDPIEDNPNHSWGDYQHNWESTLVASLLQPEVSSYEILPWPDRIFGPHALYPVNEPTPQQPKPARGPIPATYETELQSVFHALGQMQHQPARWQHSGTQNIGVLVSDTLMFQRTRPDPSDGDLGNFYGLAMPLIMHGIPAEPVQIESTYRGQDAARFLSHYRMLLLTYEGQKPPSPKFHDAIATWVRAGGALVVVDDDTDPYNRAQDWWNDNGKTAATPRQLLFQTLGLDPQSEGLHRVGKGVVLFRRASPSALAASSDGAATVLQTTRTAAAQIHLPWRESNVFILRRGPFVVAAGLDAPGGVPEDTLARVKGSIVKPLDKEQDNHTNGTRRADVGLIEDTHAPSPPIVLHGRYIDLFKADLPLVDNPRIAEGERYLYLDPGYFPRTRARVLAASGKILDEQDSLHMLTFSITSIEARDSDDPDEHDLAAIRLLLPRPAKAITLDGKPLQAANPEAGTMLLRFPARATPQQVEVSF